MASQELQKRDSKSDDIKHDEIEIKSRNTIKVTRQNSIEREKTLIRAKSDQLNMTDSLSSTQRLNKTLSQYYKQQNDDSYFENDDRGKFLAWFQHNGYESDAVDEEILSSNDPYDCAFCYFDNNFPVKYRTESENSIKYIT